MFALRIRAVAVARLFGARVRSRARACAVSPPRRGAPRHRRVATAAADASDHSASPESPPAGVILLFGFHPDEVHSLAELVGTLAREMDAGELAVARVAGDALGVTAEFLLDGAEMDARAETDTSAGDPEDAEDSFSLPPATRCVLLRGEPAKALMPDLKLEMVDAGFAPAVFGAFTAAHAFAPLGAVAGAVVAAHERYWDLGAVSNDDVSETEGVATTAWPGEEAWSPTRDPVCVMSCEMDAARVPDPPAFPFAGDDERDEASSETETSRTDSSAVVVLDGVVGEPLRAALMDAFTEPGWPHATATGPPPGKWVRETNDGVGALPSGDSSLSGSADDSARDRDPPNSWGLSATALATVARSPSVRTVLARVGALYPEYVVRFMPADALEPEGVPGAMSGLFGNGNDARLDGDDDDEGRHRIATVVGNAAMRNDSFQWHLDMDPACLHPSAPFAERFGPYVNRSRARPLFVSALVYLNGPEPWTPEKDAETLVLDPGTGTGVFIRPAPGRVLLMDQDATHRVSTPSQSTDAPRYSAVLKLCFYPKDAETRPSLTREEWGAPIRFGTAGGRRAGAGMLGGCEESEEECTPG